MHYWGPMFSSKQPHPSGSSQLPVNSRSRWPNHFFWHHWTLGHLCINTHNHTQIYKIKIKNTSAHGSKDWPSRIAWSCVNSLSWVPFHCILIQKVMCVMRGRDKNHMTKEKKETREGKDLFLLKTPTPLRNNLPLEWQWNSFPSVNLYRPISFY